MATTIDFQSSSAVISITPNLTYDSGDFLLKLTKVADDFSDSILVATSGSTSHYPKIVVLSKTGFNLACRSVNDFINSNSFDRWLLAIPHYHIGGLSILNRALLSNSSVEVYSGKWDPKSFTKQVMDQNITLSSLVPTQIYDLVSNNIFAPDSLKNILVGGGALHPNIYAEAKNLGWPLVLTFGMTESSAMFAYRMNQESNFIPLPHIQIDKTKNDRLMIKGDSVLSGYLEFNNGDFNFSDPKDNQWFTTDDIIQIDNHGFIPQGRASRIIKINGNLISLDHIQQLLSQSLLDCPALVQSEVYVTSIPDPRSENAIVLVTNITEINLSWANNVIRDRLPKYAYPTKVYYLNNLPKTDLGKIKESEIKKVLQENAI